MDPIREMLLAQAKKPETGPLPPRVTVYMVKGGEAREQYRIDARTMVKAGIACYAQAEVLAKQEEAKAAKAAKAPKPIEVAKPAETAKPVKEVKEVKEVEPEVPEVPLLTEAELKPLGLNELRALWDSKFGKPPHGRLGTARLIAGILAPATDSN